jgi:hypothetical protein
MADHLLGVRANATGPLQQRSSALGSPSMTRTRETGRCSATVLLPPATVRMLLRPAGRASEPRVATLRTDGRGTAANQTSRLPSWDRLRIAYADLAIASGGSDAELLAAARFVEHSEVASFARVAKYLGLPVIDPEFFMEGTGVRLFSFCRYCWCPAAAHGVCVFHSTRRLPKKTGALPFCGGSSVKQARRMTDSFQRNVNALVTSEELTFHDSALSGAILLPPSGLRAWLQEHRPSLDRLLGAAMPGERVLGELLGVLYGRNAGAVASVIGGCVYLLTPVSARAEAWIDA